MGGQGTGELSRGKQPAYLQESQSGDVIQMTYSALPCRAFTVGPLSARSEELGGIVLVLQR